MSSTQESDVQSTPKQNAALEQICEEQDSVKLSGGRRAIRSQNSTPGGRKSGDRTPLKGISPGRFNRSVDWRRREDHGSPTKQPRGGDSDVFRSPSSSETPSDLMTPGTNYSPDARRFKFKRSLRGSFTPATTATKSSVRSDVDAQAIFLPSACVFVANLPAGEADETLETEVLEKFSVFGTVHVKIRRDAKQMPYAFCQFENDEAASKAVTEGSKLPIRGRPCRTEHARVNRTLFVSLKTNVRPEKEDIRRDFETLGEIDEISYPSTSDYHIHGLRNGAWVKFKFWQHAKDTFNHFRTDQIWIVEWPDNSSGVNNFDEFSIFVGNLDPERAKVPELHELFSVFGEIDNIDINVRPSKYHGQQDNCFAFVRFRAREAIPAAIRERHSYELHGRRLLVFRKELQPKQASPRGSPLVNRFKQNPFLNYNRMALEQMRNPGFMPSAYPFNPFAGWIPMPPFSPLSPVSMSSLGPNGEPWSPVSIPQKSLIQPGVLPQISLINGQYYHVLPDPGRGALPSPTFHELSQQMSNLSLNNQPPMTPHYRPGNNQAQNTPPNHHSPIYELKSQYPYSHDFNGPSA